MTFYTCERPGHPGKAGVSTEDVDAWIHFMLSKGVGNVLMVMDDDEFDIYEFDVKQYCKEKGIKVYHIPFSSEGSYGKTMEVVQDVEARGEKIVSHCTGGSGRCVRVGCAWLCKKWSMSPIEASQDSIDQAVENGLSRLGDVKKLKSWIGYSSD